MELWIVINFREPRGERDGNLAFTFQAAAVTEVGHPGQEELRERISFQA